MERRVLALMALALLAGLSTPLLIETIFKGTGGVMVPPYTAKPYSSALLGVRTFNSYDEIAAFLLNASKIRQAESDAYYGYLKWAFIPTVLVPVTPLTAVPRPSEPLGEATRSGTRFSQTNVQVLGVDEPDIVKCDGKLIVVASGSKAYVVIAPDRKVVATLRFEEPIHGLFLSEDRLVVITQSAIYRILDVKTPLSGLGGRIIPPPPLGTAKTTVYVYDISDPSKPSLKDAVSVTGTVVGARLSENHVYLVASMPISGIVVPLVNSEALPPTSIAALTLVPDCYTTLLALDVEKLEYSVCSFMTRYSDRLYMSRDRLYIACTRAPSLIDAYNLFFEVAAKHLPSGVAEEIGRLLSRGELRGCVDALLEHLSELNYEECKRWVERVGEELEGRVFVDKTEFYVFDVQGLTIKLRGSFEVEGLLLEQFAMEELGDSFIVATTSSEWVVKIFAGYVVENAMPLKRGEVEIIEYRDGEVVERTFYVTPEQPPPARSRYPLSTLFVYPLPLAATKNNVFVVNIENMKLVGELRGLAEGERVYAARLIKNVFFLVTFRQVDPLFAINVSDPSRPKVLGYLKIPGFSDYLHPLPGDKMLGIGMEDDMLKISLFDVADPTKMAETSKVKLKAGSIALMDHHAVTVDLDNELVFIPVNTRYASGVLALSVQGGVLTVAKVLEHPRAVRTVYVGDELYTISPSAIRVFKIDKLEQVGEIELK